VSICGAIEVAVALARLRAVQERATPGDRQFDRRVRQSSAHRLATVAVALRLRRLPQSGLPLISFESRWRNPAIRGRETAMAIGSNPLRSTRKSARAVAVSPDLGGRFMTQPSPPPPWMSVPISAFRPSRFGRVQFSSQAPTAWQHIRVLPSDSGREGCGAKIGSKAYLTTQQLWDESGRHVKLG
jgi:hypothetical protein